jgi:hypothetical protein
VSTLFILDGDSGRSYNDFDDDDGFVNALGAGGAGFSLLPLTTEGSLEAVAALAAALAVDAMGGSGEQVLRAGAAGSALAALSQLDASRAAAAALAAGGNATQQQWTSPHITEVLMHGELAAIRARAEAVAQARARAEAEARAEERSMWMQRFTMVVNGTNITTGTNGTITIGRWSTVVTNWSRVAQYERMNRSTVYSEGWFNESLFHSTLNDSALELLNSAGLPFVHADVVDAFVQSATEDVYFHCMGQARLESLHTTVVDEPLLFEPFNFFILAAAVLICCGVSSCCFQCLRCYWFSKAKYRIHSEHKLAKRQQELEEQHMTTFRTKGQVPAADFDDEDEVEVSSGAESYRLAKTMTKSGANKSQILKALGDQDPGSITYHKEMASLYKEVDQWNIMTDLTTDIHNQPDVVKSRKVKRSNYHNYGSKSAYGKGAKKKRRKATLPGPSGPSSAAAKAMEAAKLRASTFAAGATTGELRSVIDPHTGRKLVLPPMYSLPVAE